MATKIRSHKDARRNVIALLLVAEYDIIIYLIVEEDVVEVIDTANAPLLREPTELIFVHQHFFVLLTIY